MNNFPNHRTTRAVGCLIALIWLMSVGARANDTRALATAPDIAPTGDGPCAVAPIENTFTTLPRGGDWCATAAPLLGNGDMGVCLLGEPQSLNFMLGKNDFWHLRLANGQTSALNFGSLMVSMPALNGAKLELTQHIADAMTTGALTLPDGSGVKISVFVAASANVLVVELDALNRPLEASAELVAGKSHFQEEADNGSAHEISWITRNFTREVDMATGASAALKLVGADTPKFTLTPGKPVTLLVSIRSNFDTKDHLAGARELAQSSDAAKLLADHKAWWARFWGKSFVDIPDPELMRRYYTAQYVIGSASRNPQFPPGIIGPWITSGSNTFAWGGYWMNYNHAAPYYGLYSSNHIEQADPQDAPILQFMPRGREYASDILHIRGLLYPVGIGPRGFDICYMARNWAGGPPNLEGGKALTWGQRSDAAYNLVNMSQRWYTTYDPAYGEKIYPYMRGVVDFWEDYLTLEGNRYVIDNDAVQEGTGANKNPINSLGLVRNAFALALDMSKELKKDPERRAKWQDILNRMSDYPTAQRNGKTIFILSEKGPTAWGSNTVNIQHIYPAGGIGLDSDPRLLQIARDTLDAYPRWYDTNGSNSFFPAAARIGYDPEVILTNLHRYPMGANGFFAGNPHGIENCSTVPNTLDEMLMQSHEGVIRFFPVWPGKESARFLNLRAYGAFLVSASKQSGAPPEAVRIVSERGRDCTVANPWPGQSAQVFRNGKLAETVAGGRFTLKTAPGETLLLGPPGATLSALTQELLPPSSPAMAFDGDAPLLSPCLVTVPKTITLRSAAQAQIFYTLDGSRPTRSSTPCDMPLIIDKTCVLRMLALEPDHSPCLSQYVFMGPESGAQLINTFDSENDVARVKMSEFYLNEPPQRFDTIPSDGRPLVPGKHGILRLHPKDPNTPVMIERVVKIPAAGVHPKLRLVTSADPNEGGSYYIMQAGVSANGTDTEWFKEEKISAPADGWKTLDYDLSKYADQDVILRIKAGSGGAWHNNRAYFDEISVIEDGTK